jgi:peptidoglycan hydrolase-like protein with peptidoglycan-binding domain
VATKSGIHRRSRTFVGVVTLASLCMLGASSALASSSGGTSAGRTGVGGPKVRVRTPKVAIAHAHCVPTIHCSANLRQVSIHGTLQLAGRGLAGGMVVAFPRSPGARIGKRSPSAHLHHSKLGLVATIPASAHSGRIQILLGGGRRSNAYGPIYVAKHALHPPTPPQAPAGTALAPAPAGSAFEGQGMWIWYVKDSEKGDLEAIIARAHQAGVSTLFVKSSDGPSNYWSQFSTQLVETLHAAGLKVCAWQYVYGSNPVGEAQLGARAVQTGADCLVIDAEAEYEGRYEAAQSYIRTLRAAIGPEYPVGLASFPYVDYHLSFPYSVFLGPEGAQFNAPQMYWKAIETSVASVFVHTYEENLIYGRPIAPLGQTYQSPSSQELVGFRSLSAAYGAGGLSFWDWQETTSSGWSALAAPLNPNLKAPSPELTSPLLRKGAKGDQVLWMQEHLASAVPGQATSGIFDAQTASNLESFQASKGLPATGETDASTWGALLALPMVAVDWSGSKPG